MTRRRTRERSNRAVCLGAAPGYESPGSGWVKRIDPATNEVVEPEGHRNSDRARDLPIHESFRVRTARGRRGSSMLETRLNARFFSLKHSSLGLRASPLARCGISQIVSHRCLTMTGRRNEPQISGRDLTKCTLHP
jgi:hypothetical protein